MERLGLGVIMKFLLSLFLLIAVVEKSNAAAVSYTVFRGSGGITIVSNPPTGTIVIDGSGVSTGTNAAAPPFSSVQFNSNGVMRGSSGFVYTNGFVGIGTNAPGSPLHVRPVTSGANYLRVDDTNGTPRLQVGVVPGLSQLGAIYLGDVTPTALNYAIRGDVTQTVLNSPSATSPIYFSQGDQARWYLATAGHFLAQDDNTYDIGASGASRPKDYFGAGVGVFGGRITGGEHFITANAAGGFGAGRFFILPGASDGIIGLYNAGATDFNRLTLGGTTAAFPAIGRGATNGHLTITGADGAVGGTATNGLWLMGGPIIQDFSVVAPGAPVRTGALYWNNGTNVCVVLRDHAGGLTTNKLTMSAWP